MFKILLILFVACSQVENLSPPPEKTIPVPKPAPVNSQLVKDFCKRLDERFKDFSWGKSHCEKTQWKSVRKSHFGNPIMWTVFEDAKVKNTTVLLCGVHPDEITPVKFCFDIINDLRKNPSRYENARVVVAPIVTADPFFFERPTRTNAKKVDVNRNFPTDDWKKSARKLWREKYSANPRRDPGKHAMSEAETVFQVNLIKLYDPNYVISVHAPLKLLDYDGPSLVNTSTHTNRKLLEEMSKKAGNYKVANYPFFPGSLGNWAGNERKIPTFTLELPNSDWNKTNRYFKLFSPAVYHVFTIPGN